ncbi:MAG: hypothetical protein R3Y56_02765 [Akkermansia sp.]
MSISNEQIELIREWAAAGIDLNGIQKNLTDAGVSIRFMELRFLLLDNEIEIAEIKPAEPEAKAAEEQVAAAPTGSMQVALDELTIPGTMISGKAIFPSGIRGSWQFDQRGQFGWSALDGEPSDNEMRAFQVELNKLLSQGG